MDAYVGFVEFYDPGRSKIWIYTPKHIPRQIRQQ